MDKRPKLSLKCRISVSELLIDWNMTKKWCLINGRCKNIFSFTQCQKQDMLATKIDEIEKNLKLERKGN